MQSQCRPMPNIEYNVFVKLNTYGILEFSQPKYSLLVMESNRPSNILRRTSMSAVTTESEALAFPVNKSVVQKMILSVPFCTLVHICDLLSTSKCTEQIRILIAFAYHLMCFFICRYRHSTICVLFINKNLATANRSRVSCAHNTSRAFIGLNITP